MCYWGRAGASVSGVGGAGSLLFRTSSLATVGCRDRGCSSTCLHLSPPVSVDVWSGSVFVFSACASGSVLLQSRGRGLCEKLKKHTEHVCDCVYWNVPELISVHCTCVSGLVCKSTEPCRTHSKVWISKSQKGLCHGASWSRGTRAAICQHRDTHTVFL